MDEKKVDEQYKKYKEDIERHIQKMDQQAEESQIYVYFLSPEKGYKAFVPKGTKV